jgi:ABC-type transport system involved in multi-copper enzyme maturation permease subunit
MNPGRFDWVRLTLRLHRFELFAFGAAIIVLVIGSFLVAAYIDGFKLPAECVTQDGNVPFSCESAFRAVDNARSIGALIMSPLLIVTYTIGLFLGVPVIARELERGTVRLAWWLTPSRWRWYLARVVPILGAVALLTFAAGVASDRMFAVNNPSLDMSRAFDGYGARGGLLAARAVFIFAVAVFVGSFIGRSLPAVIVAALVAVIGLSGGMQVHQRIMASEAVAVPMDPFEGGQTRPGDLYIDQRFVLPDGSLVGYESFNGSGPYDDQGMPLYPQVMLVMPGERYRFVETREALVLGAGSLAALLLAGFVVARRRPG